MFYKTKTLAKTAAVMVALATVFLCMQAAAADSVGAENMALILDASGSMWGQIDGRAKIDIAREVLKELIRDLPDDLNVGLTVYGHRRKGDCNDVEELVPLQPIDKAALIDKIKAVSPKGKTPITLSVRNTVEKLKSLEDETAVILVSDGRETCEGDPCALVAELKKSGIRFTMHVVGFDVTEAEREQLACMARAGGGEYFTAKTAQEFRLAAKQAVEESRNFGHLKVTATRNGVPFSALAEVFPQGADQSVHSGMTASAPDDPGFKLKPGVYDVRVTDRDAPGQPPVRIEAVEVAAGKTAECTAAFSSGVLRMTVLKQGTPSLASVKVYEAGTENKAADGDTSVDNPLTLYLLPGTYDVKVRDDRVQPPQEIVFPDMTLAAGETVEKRVEFGHGSLSVGVLVNGEKGHAGLYVYKAGTDDRVATGDTSRDNPRAFKLAPGTYDLKVRYKAAKPETERIFTKIGINAGQIVEKQVEFGFGGLSVEVLVNGDKGSAGIYLYEAGTNNRVTTGDTSRDNPRSFKLAAGNYDIKVVYKKATPETEQLFSDIEIGNGQTVERKAEFQEGLLEIRITSEGQTVKGNFELFHPGEKKRFDTEDANRETRMRPGDYEALVRAYSLPDKPEKRVTFSIRAGESTTLDVEF